MTDALAIRSAQFLFQLNNERDWERARRPYYNVWPSIVPMLTRLNLELDSALIQLPLPALSVRLARRLAIRQGCHVVVTASEPGLTDHRCWTPQSHPR